ncbi:hypothetical protein BpHYR1_016003, partial [Brachionus plicatilis]
MARFFSLRLAATINELVADDESGDSACVIATNSAHSFTNSAELFLLVLPLELEYWRMRLRPKSATTTLR